MANAIAVGHEIARQSLVLANCHDRDDLVLGLVCSWWISTICVFSVLKAGPAGVVLSALAWQSKHVIQARNPSSHTTNKYYQ